MGRLTPAAALSNFFVGGNGNPPSFAQRPVMFHCLTSGQTVSGQRRLCSVGQSLRILSLNWTGRVGSGLAGGKIVGRRDGGRE